MKQLRLQNESGFTLIELLVVVAIIGILAAIAIPQFSAYRKRGYEAAVKSDLRNAATGQEAYFTTAFTYRDGVLTSGNLTGFNASPTVAVASGGGANTYDIDCYASKLFHHSLDLFQWKLAQLPAVPVRNHYFSLTLIVLQGGGDWKSSPLFILIAWRLNIAANDAA